MLNKKSITIDMTALLTQITYIWQHYSTNTNTKPYVLQLKRIEINSNELSKKSLIFNKHKLWTNG